MEIDLELFDEEEENILFDVEENLNQCNYCYGTGLDRELDADCMICWGDGFV